MGWMLMGAVKRPLDNSVAVKMAVLAINSVEMTVISVNRIDRTLRGMWSVRGILCGVSQGPEIWHRLETGHTHQ